MKSLLLLGLFVATVDPQSCTSIKEPSPAPPPAEFRYEEVEAETVHSTNYTVFRDRKTQREYLFVKSGEAGGLIELPQR